MPVSLLRRILARPVSPVWVNRAVLVLGLALVFHRVNPVRELPDAWDSLEVLGILTYLCNHPAPSLAPNYYPTGYPLAIYAQLWAVVIMLPFCRLIPGPLILNAANILSHVVAFQGALKLAATVGVPAIPALLVAFGYAFSPFRLGPEGHYNVLFSSAVLPWAVAFTLLTARPARGAGWHRPVAAGLAWAATLLLHPYFVSVWVFVWGVVTWQHAPARRRLLASAAITLALTVPYGLAIAGELASGWWESVGGAAYLFQSGVSLDFAVLPSTFNFLVGRLVAEYTGYRSPPNVEGQLGTLGPVVWALLLLGLSRYRVLRGELGGLLLAGGLFLILALGPVAMVKGQTLSIGIFRPVNEVLWDLGRLLKPATFAEPPPDRVLDGLPLPGFLWLVLVPLSENVRAVARLAIPAGLLLGTAAGRVLAAMPRRWALAFGLVWLAAALPGPVAWVPIPQPHPVYDWVATRKAEGAVLVIGGHGPVTRAPHLWQTLTRGIPTVNGYASYQPAYYTALWRGLAESDLAFADTVKLLSGLGVRFLLVEVGDDVDRLMYARASRSADLEFIRCFDPPEPWWQLPVCAFEVRPVPPEGRRFDVLFDQGWLIREDWGLWATGRQATAFVWWDGRPARLELVAFPNCVPEEAQTLEVELNGRRVLRHQFGSCNPSTLTAELRAGGLPAGWSRLTFSFGYTRATASSPQPLAVGATRLKVTLLVAGSG